MHKLLVYLSILILGIVTSIYIASLRTQNNQLKAEVALWQSTNEENLSLLAGKEVTEKELKDIINGLGKEIKVLSEPLKKITSLDRAIVTNRAKNSGKANIKLEDIPSLTNTLPNPTKNIIPTCPIHDDYRPPFGLADYRIKVFCYPNEDYVSYELDQRLEVIYLDGIDQTGKEVAGLKVFELNKDGKRINELEITKRSYLFSDWRYNQLRWWTPHLEFGIQARPTKEEPIAFQISLPISSWGLTELDNYARFIIPGIGINRTGLIPTIAPVSINIGKHLPLVDDLWIAPLIGYYSNDSKIALSLGTTL